MNHKILIHGHRGSRGTHPENTFPAFQEAIDVGADYIELDVVLSQDAVPMVFHDMVVSSRLCRLKNGQNMPKVTPVHKLTAEELQNLDVGVATQPAFPEQIKVPGTQIPTLKQLLEWHQTNEFNIGFNIELKIPTDGPAQLYGPDLVAKRVIDCVTPFLDRKFKLLYQSDNHRVAQAFLAAGVKTSFIYRYEQDFEKKTKAFKAPMATPYHGLLTKDKVQWCRDNGIELATWTVNAKHRWERYLKWGVTGIITDYPRILSDFLKQKSKEL